MHFSLSGRDPYTPSRFIRDVERDMGVATLHVVDQVPLDIHQEFMGANDPLDISLFPFNVSGWKFVNMIVGNGAEWDTHWVICDAYWVPENSTLFTDWSQTVAEQTVAEGASIYEGSQGLMKFMLDNCEAYTHLHIYVGEY